VYLDQIVDDDFLTLKEYTHKDLNGEWQFITSEEKIKGHNDYEF